MKIEIIVADTTVELQEEVNCFLDKVQYPRMPEVHYKLDKNIFGRLYAVVHYVKLNPVKRTVIIRKLPPYKYGGFPSGDLNAMQ